MKKKDHCKMQERQLNELTIHKCDLYINLLHGQEKQETLYQL